MVHKIDDILGSRNYTITNNRLKYNNIEGRFEDNWTKDILKDALNISNRDLLRLSYDVNCFVIGIDSDFDTVENIQNQYIKCNVLNKLYSKIQERLDGPLFIDTKAAALLSLVWNLDNGLAPKYILNDSYCVMIVHNGMKLYSIFNRDKSIGNINVESPNGGIELGSLDVLNNKVLDICTKSSDNNCWRLQDNVRSMSSLNMSRVLCPKMTAKEYKEHLEWYFKMHVDKEEVYGINLSDYMIKEDGSWKIKK